MWFILDANGFVDKVSRSEENSDQVFIDNCPDDIIDNPSKYSYVNGEFIEIVE